MYEKFWKNIFIILLIIIIGYTNINNNINNNNFNKGVSATKESEIISSWAQQFGDELWELAQRMTKSNDIKAKYKKFNARVEHKGNETLLNSILENVGRMLQRKIDAIRCTLAVAEDAAEQFEFNETNSSNYTYYSSKYSPINELNITQTYKNLPEIILKNKNTYLPMYLNQDTHFYNISVNTSYSAVHVPTNIYDKDPKVLEALQWSDTLDEVYVQNYNSDPALSWQYFCSDTGILRLYPAKPWEADDVDMYDCRKRSWYIETATCSKDIVILLDNSGSMTGFRNFIAQLTVKSILDTFSNNDFINIYNYSAEVQALVPCFNETLLQATPENIAVFNKAVKALKPDGYANVTNAFVAAFKLLQKYRDIRKCNESATGCNQAIMLITDGIPGNITDVFEEYNWLQSGNETKTPVRVFTYLLGKEVTKVREIQWMACLNRGYYSHIQNLDEVQSEVLKYVTVIATPLVLQGVDHPPTWTHAFTDRNYEEEDDDAPPRLMIAVGVPVFDRKLYKNNTTKGVRLLGVAGTDVPVDDINKLSLPYKLGVNGYSFIVSNNGFVLLHPDLRPVENHITKVNYNSIDITEVEQFDDGSSPREIGDQLLQLRQSLVFNDVGKIMNINVKFHYDKMRRVSIEQYDYYFAPLPNTPFSLGLALPSGYGNTWIKVGDEVKRNLHMNVNMSDFLIGENWKIHPEWVYCKYHYLEGHEFKTPEDELRHFLNKLYDPHWKWSQQYEVETIYEHEDINNNNNDDLNCGRKTLEDDAYYCNRELIQLLIFDAKVTNSSYGEWMFENDIEKQLIERYNATLRYVATMSGLTRWQFIYGEVEVDTDREFGDYHTTAIDETWYKAAILQHKIDPQSFVYSVPHNTEPLEDEEIQVTASHGIYPRDGGVEAPGCVVGFQFSHAMLYERFMEITSKINCDGCNIRPCNSDVQDCYVIDHNGYIVLSEKDNDTGKFFGEVEGAIMESLLEINVFKRVQVLDLQALCSEEVEVFNDGNIFLNPFKMILLGIKLLFTEILFTLSRINLWVFGDEIIAYDEDVSNDYSSNDPNKPPQRKALIDEENEYYNRVKVREFETVYRACDKRSNLFVLQQHLFMQGQEFISYAKSECSRPYYFKRIPYSNLLIIVINAEHQTCTPIISTKPEILEYDIEFPCHKLKVNDLPSRRLDECFTEHPDEANLTYCGKAVINKLQLNTIIFSFVLLLYWMSSEKVLL